MSTAVIPPMSITAGRGWRLALGALLLLWAGVIWLYRDTGLAMVEIWNRSDTFAHAWVVPPIALWLAWRVGAQVLALDARPALSALLCLVPIGLLWLLAELVAVNTAKQFALVGMLVACVPAVLGWSVARLLMFPLGFLFFAVPAGDFLTPTLMAWTADITVGALRLTGIPVYREGMNFVIPSGTWSVVEACSGTRYLIASVMVGTLFAFLNYSGQRKRWIFVGISILVPILANWVRAYMIVMLGHLSGNELAVGADHLVYGWVLFGIVIMLLYAIGARWADPIHEPVAVAASNADWPVSRGALVAGLAALLLLAPLGIGYRIDGHGQRELAVPLALLTALPEGWRSADDPAPGWLPGFVAPSASARVGLIAEDGSRGGVFVAYYRQQNDQRKLVSSLNGIAAGGADHQWVEIEHERLPLAGLSWDRSLRATRLVQTEWTASRSQQRSRLRIAQVYWVDGQLVAGDVPAKLLGAWGRLMGRGDDGAVILVYVDDSDANRSPAALKRLIDGALPAVVAHLSQLREQLQKAGYER